MGKPAKKRIKKRSVQRAASRARGKRSVTVTEIVFSYAEIDFLRKITKKEADSASPPSSSARLSLRDKLLDINFGRPSSGGGGFIVLPLTRPEIDFLQKITKEVYSFITAEERRARLILREKILIAVEKVTGRKVRSEKSS